jgi:excinuclease ABC subunit C
MPGVYFLWDEAGVLLYVGKAAILRARLSTYRRAIRGAKERKLIAAASRITWEICASELDACLREVEAIQTQRPKKNISAAYSFMYPFVGAKEQVGALWLCFTTLPAELSDYQLFGAFRSREVTATAFFALTRLLKFIGHPEKSPANIPDYSYCFGFRRLPAQVYPELIELLKGFSPDLMETLFHRLLDHAGARAKATEVKTDLRDLRTFWRAEAVPLNQAIAATGFQSYPVSQAERDPLFLKASFAGELDPS